MFSYLYYKARPLYSSLPQRDVVLSWTACGLRQISYGVLIDKTILIIKIHTQLQGWGE